MIKIKLNLSRHHIALHDGENCIKFHSINLEDNFETPSLILILLLGITISTINSNAQKVIIEGDATDTTSIKARMELYTRQTTQEMLQAISNRTRPIVKVSKQKVNCPRCRLDTKSSLTQKQKAITPYKSNDSYCSKCDGDGKIEQEEF